MKTKNKNRRRRRAAAAANATATVDRNLFRSAVDAIILAEGTAAPISLTAVAVIENAVQADAANGRPAKLPTLTIKAYNGGSMQVPGYYRPVVVDIAGVTGFGRTIPILRAHDMDRIVGHGEARVEGFAIHGSGTLSAENDDAAEVLKLANNGFPWQASIGVKPTRLENVDAGRTVRVNGQDVHGPAVIVRAGKLFEVSIVPLGADESTATEVAAQGVGAMTFDQWLKAKGWDAAQLNAEQLATLRASFDASGWGGNPNPNPPANHGGNGGGNPNPAPNPPANHGAGGGGNPPITASGLSSAIIAARAREERSQAYERIIAVALTRGMLSNEAELLVAQAEQAQMSETQFELEVMRAERENITTFGTARRRRENDDTRQDVLEAALAITASQTEYVHLKPDGTKETVQLYKPELLEAAHAAYPRGITLMELVVKAARRNGFITDSYRISKAMLQAAFAPILARGASTYDLSGVLSNVANKSIVAGFNAIETSWREISAIGTVTDFKEITHYALTGDFVYEKVSKGGELTHATMGEQSYANKADTYGKIFAITRQDFINDDLSAFNRVRTMLGRGAALKLNLVFWTEFLKNVTTFFTTTRKNYFAGATSALSITSLTTAEQLFLDQTDPDGHPLGLAPAILLVPNALAVPATTLSRDTEIRDNTDSKVYSTTNPHAGKFRPVRSSYLNNATVPNGSALHWFVLAEPGDLPLIETVFLNGQQMPIVESAEADFDMLGVQMRGYHDFGSRKQEYRAGVRSKGEA